MRRSFLIGLFALCGFALSAQDATLDSIKQVAATAKEDTLRVLALIDWDYRIYRSDPDLDMELNHQIESLCKTNLKKKDLHPKKKRFFQSKLAFALNSFGLVERGEGDTTRAGKHFREALHVYRDLNDRISQSKIYDNLAQMHLNVGDHDRASEFLQYSLKLCKENHDTVGLGRNYNLQAMLYENWGKMDEAVKAYQKSYALMKARGDRAGMAIAMNNLGGLYQVQGHYPKAIEKYAEALRIREAINDLAGIASTSNNIGSTYMDMGDYEKAVPLYEKALRLYDEAHNLHGKSGALNNLGTVYEKRKDTAKALSYYLKGYTIKKQIQDLKGMSISRVNTASLYLRMGQLDSALIHLDEAMEICSHTNDIVILSAAKTIMSMIQFKKGNVNGALRYGLDALHMSQEVGIPDQVMNVADILYSCYKKTGQTAMALRMHELYYQTRDSLTKTENQRAVIRQQFQYDYDKKKAADSLQTQQRLAISALQHEQQIQKRNLILYYSLGGLAIVVVFSFFLYNRLQLTRKQKNIIEEQKTLVEEKQKEISDSIQYAKHLQQAILPPLTQLKDSFADAFVMYRPRDIVAGDFYFYERVQDAKGKEHILVAVADCTGHGVPGAMVSVICSNALNKCVLELGLLDPGEILNKTRELVIQRLTKSGSEVRDGMDISLASLQFEIRDSKFEIENKTESEISNLKSEISLRWAGANNPLWILRQGTDLIDEIKADKQPIGKYAHDHPFTTHQLTVQKGDRIFMSSDGYQDQFGGERSKKFKASRLKVILAECRSLSMDKTNAKLEQEFSAWQGDYAQTDDVCVMGLQI